MSDLYWLTDEQVAKLSPFFPKSHGKPRVDDKRVLSGIIFFNRNGLRWRDAPRNTGHTRRCTAGGSVGARKAFSCGLWQAWPPSTAKRIR